MKTLPFIVLVAAATTLARATPVVAAKPTRPIAVIVALDSKITGLSRAELAHCFSGDLVTAGGTRLMPFNYAPGAPEREAFDRAILGRSPDETGRYWIDRKVRGERGPPRSLPSSAYVVKVIAKLPGAIGYVPLDQVTPDVKVIAIDGILLTDPAYPITIK